jgi:hypothetical protein
MKIELELSEKRNVGEFSLGYFTIEKDGLLFTNKFKKPNQACMLFHSLPLLFDGLNRLRNNNGRIFVFQPIGCSYELVFERQKENLKIYEDSKSSIICNFKIFAEVLLNTYFQMMNRQKLTLESLDSISEDFEESLNSFKNQFLL